ncbi:hypothetical protein [Thalassobacillus hwangdonensis]|uniref:V-ATPase proteolipid subunit C-like domain-containing protein n=1 Tax=Thalassobacillus hwangdonensis TaxID=546108 RepID=A0ABW3L4L6_9BACI
MEYLLVIASLIAVIGIFASYQKAISYFPNREIDAAFLQKVQTKLFIATAIVEVIPILLIVFAMTQLENAEFNPTIPIAIIIIVYIAIVLKTLMSGRDTLGSIDTKYQPQFKSLMIVTVGLISAIPIVSVVLLISL